jgi:hypothetical protein
MKGCFGKVVFLLIVSLIVLRYASVGIKDGCALETR